MWLGHATTANGQLPAPTSTPSSKTQLRPVKKVIATATAAAEVTFLTTNPPQTLDVDGLIAVSGLVFEDENHNGLRDEGEPALKGVTISAEMTGDTASQVVALTMTDERGEFHLQASSRALISIQVPDGFRPVTPITRFAAAEQLVFGLRTDTMTVERVVQSPPVNIIAPPLHITPEIAFGLGAFGLLSLVFVTIVIRHQSQQTQALRELVNGQVMLRSQSQMNETNWQSVIEQAIADSWGASAQADSFLGLSCLPHAWMRFLMKDGRIFTFTVARAGLAGFHISRPRRSSGEQRLMAAIELRRVFEHFARTSNQPAMLPRQCEWFVCVDRVSCAQGIRIVLPKSLRIKAAQ